MPATGQPAHGNRAQAQCSACVGKMAANHHCATFRRTPLRQTAYPVAARLLQSPWRAAPLSLETPMSDSLQTQPPIEVRMAEIVFPNHTNHMGTLFGGQALAWMDKAAFLAASRYARRAVVTARSDQVDFKLPIRQGQMVETIARVVSVGRSSIKVEVELIAEDLLSGARELCTRGHFVMIALGDNGKPTTVPPLPAVSS